MPACMFKAVSEDVSEARDWTIKGFVEFYNKVNRDTSIEGQEATGTAGAAGSAAGNEGMAGGGE